MKQMTVRGCFSPNFFQIYQTKNPWDFSLSEGKIDSSFFSLFFSTLNSDLLFSVICVLSNGSMVYERKNTTDCQSSIEDEIKFHIFFALNHLEMSQTAMSRTLD